MQSVQQLLLWAAEHPFWLLTFGFLLAFFEALAVVGIVLPGIFLLFVLGTLIGLDSGLFLATTVVVSLGAMAGDGVSFWLGRTHAARLRGLWLVRNRQHWIDAGETFFRRHGGGSIFIARFIGPLRPVVPLVAGSLGMPVRVFVPRMLIACVLWAPLMLLPGALFGESLQLAAEVGGRLTIVLIVLVIGGWALAWLTRMTYEAGARRAPWALKNLALWLRRHPRTQRWIGPLLEPGGREVLSVLILGLLLLISLAVLLAALLAAPLSSRAWQAGFELSGLAASLRSHLADPLFIAVSIAMSPVVLWVVVAGFWLGLLALGRRSAAWHWLPATLGGALLARLLDQFMGWLLGRPENIDQIGQVPHFGMVLAIMTFGFMALMVGRKIRPRRRKWLYLSVVLWLALFGFGEFYLARATLNGLIAAVALAGGWLAIVGIGYRLRASEPRFAGLLLVLFVGLWLGIGSYRVSLAYPERRIEHRLEQPLRELAVADWWEAGWRQLPALRSRVAPAASRAFELQVAADPDRIVEALRRWDWKPAKRLSKDGLRAILSARAPVAAVPHITRDFAGQPAQLRRKLVLAENRVVLLRLWDSGMRLGAARTPVWLGQIEMLEPTRRFGLARGWRRIDGQGRALEHLHRALHDWARRQPEPNAPWLLADPLLLR